MTAFLVLALLAIICALGSVYTAVRIANDLRSRGMRANPALVRWMVFKYMADYKRITVSETGKVGPLYHQCATISALAALFAVAAIFVKALTR
jgi:hypothetical protein